jgi:hypothetical protein
VFTVVDCTACVAGSKWIELHVILRDQKTKEPAFAIVYLEDGSVTLEYGLTVPSLRRLSTEFAGATWTAPPPT